MLPLADPLNRSSHATRKSTPSEATAGAGCVPAGLRITRGAAPRGAPPWSARGPPQPFLPRPQEVAASRGHGRRRLRAGGPAEHEGGGVESISTDAGASAEQQHTDVENLISQGANSVIILAQDGEAILPAVQSALDQGIPVVAYDRLIENPGALYVTFDNVEIGRLEAEAVYDVVPKGNYVFIKGSPTDPNANFLRAGQQEVVDAAVKKGDIKIVGDEYTDGWKPDV